MKIFDLIHLSIGEEIGSFSSVNAFEMKSFLLSSCMPLLTNTIFSITDIDTLMEC